LVLKRRIRGTGGKMSYSGISVKDSMENIRSDNNGWV
jgi:hypothetical protein